MRIMSQLLDELFLFFHELNSGLGDKYIFMHLSPHNSLHNRPLFLFIGLFQFCQVKVLGASWARSLSLEFLGKLLSEYIPFLINLTDVIDDLRLEHASSLGPFFHSSFLCLPDLHGGKTFKLTIVNGLEPVKLAHSFLQSRTFSTFARQLSTLYTGLNGMSSLGFDRFLALLEGHCLRHHFRGVSSLYLGRCKGCQAFAPFFEKTRQHIY